MSLLEDNSDTTKSNDHIAESDSGSDRHESKYQTEDLIDISPEIPHLLEQAQASANNSEESRGADDKNVSCNVGEPQPAEAHQSCDSAQLIPPSLMSGSSAGSLHQQEPSLDGFSMHSLNSLQIDTTLSTVYTESDPYSPSTDANTPKFHITPPSEDDQEAEDEVISADLLPSFAAAFAGLNAAATFPLPSNKPKKEPNISFLSTMTSRLKTSSSPTEEGNNESENDHKSESIMDEISIPKGAETGQGPDQQSCDVAPQTATTPPSTSSKRSFAMTWGRTRSRGPETPAMGKSMLSRLSTRFKRDSVSTAGPEDSADEKSSTTMGSLSRKTDMDSSSRRSIFTMFSSSARQLVTPNNSTTNDNQTPTATPPSTIGRGQTLGRGGFFRSLAPNRTANTEENRPDGGGDVIEYMDEPDIAGPPQKSSNIFSTLAISRKPDKLTPSAGSDKSPNNHYLQKLNRALGSGNLKETAANRRNWLTDGLNRIRRSTRRGDDKKSAVNSATPTSPSRSLQKCSTEPNTPSAADLPMQSLDTGHFQHQEPSQPRPVIIPSRRHSLPLILSPKNQDGEEPLWKAPANVSIAKQKLDVDSIDTLHVGLNRAETASSLLQHHNHTQQNEESTHRPLEFQVNIRSYNNESS